MKTKNKNSSSLKQISGETTPTFCIQNCNPKLDVAFMYAMMSLVLMPIILTLQNLVKSGYLFYY